MTQSKQLRRGYTTGACAQAATRAAALSLLNEEGSLGKGASESVEILLPNGEAARFTYELHEAGCCSVVKDAGDDPDVTDGVLIFARVKPQRDGTFRLVGGDGVGRVTLEGLAVKPGLPAINPVPYEHIRAEAQVLLPQGAEIEIFIPGGEELALKTFNPKLGIMGGLSILGTTGRVEPWSAEAYRESLLPQLEVAKAAGIAKLVLVPGAKGEKAAIKAGCDPLSIVQMGNHAGFMLAAARERGFQEVALVGHVSKLAKLARGDFDTHSRSSSMPLDVLADCAQSCGWSRQQAAELTLLPTAEAAVRLLVDAGADKVLEEAAARVATTIRENFDLKVEVILSDGAGIIVGRVSAA